MRCAAAAGLLAAGLAAATPAAGQSVEIRVRTTRALATVLAEVGSDFERGTGHRLVVTRGLPTDFERRFAQGEAVDLVISGTPWVDQWIREGRLLATSRMRDAAAKLLAFLASPRAIAVIEAQGMEPQSRPRQR